MQVPTLLVSALLGVQLSGAVTILFANDDLRQNNDHSNDRPNVILILADDLAVGDLGGGDDMPTRTPSLDRLAKESVQFDQAYSASCVCAPARAALLTGRYPHRTGVVTLNMNKHPRLTRLRRDETTIADIMRGAGYRTGLIGKWHVGRGKEYHPLARGFDEFEGFDGSQVLSYFDYSLDINGKIETVDGKYLTEDLSDRAIQFVRRNRTRPFFLHLTHYAPHRPIEAPARTIKRYHDQGFHEATATLYAMIEIMDRGIGELDRELSTLGLSGNTILIFASDNGPDPLTDERFNHGLRGTKYQIYEGGIRVPLMVRWPNRFRPGVRKQLVHFVDLLPTLLDLCEIDSAQAKAIDGASFARVLRNESATFEPTRYWQWNRGEPNDSHNAAARAGHFKLVRPFITRGSKVSDSTLPLALYDLENDPTESHNLAESLPRMVARMESGLRQWCRSVEQDRIRQTAPTGKE